MTLGNQAPPRLLTSERLLLRASSPDLTGPVRDFQQRNAAHLAPWEPPRAPNFWDEALTRERLGIEATEFDEGRLWRFWLSPHEAPGLVIGQCQVSQVARGVFQSAMLGYSLDAGHVGGGLMTEALRRLIDELFGPRVWLHRLQASVRPDNGPSRRVLERLGFQREGVSPRYLFIDGQWRDHETHALLNPAWPERLPPPA